MPICIECRYPVPTLYTTYSKADDKALGKGVRLTQCPRCKRFADKYVEHDFVVLFIDLVLIKPQVYRHLLFNRLGREDDRFDSSIIRLGVLLLLFDVYLTWRRIETATNTYDPTMPHSFLTGPNNLTSSTISHVENTTDAGAAAVPVFPSTQPILLRYLFFLVLCTLETASFHLPIRLLLGATIPQPFRALVPHYPHAALISTALLVSSFTKLFPLLLLIWRYDVPSSASAVSWAVIINNVAALEILLDCGYARAAMLAGVGAMCRAGVEWGILRAFGVDGSVVSAGVVKTEDLIAMWSSFTEGVGWG